MRRKETMPLGEILKCFIKEQHLDVKIKETETLALVDDVFGKHLASYITNKYIFQKKLFINVSSSIVRNEMMMVRQRIIKVLNEKAGEEIITEIVIK